ncbi:hypothetical protein WG66_000610 [Moniliophthora roreri]|nr:hypothetical protein WG66_000610 [Moniliophthora roreri]
MPKLYLKEVIFGGQTFCCCLPVRLGVICMSFLGILFGGVLSIVLWFEVAHTPNMESSDKAAFVIAGLVQTVLLVASMLGFIGAIVRKQVFVQIYAYIIYVHFVINVAVAGYLLYVVTHFSSTAIEKACQGTVQDAGAQEQCSDFLRTGRGIFIAIAAIVLITELYGALIVARYVRQIKGEKRTARHSRLQVMQENEFRMRNRHSKGLSSASGTSPADFSRDFDPYDDVDNHHGPSSSRGNLGGGATRDSHQYERVPDVEDGYGGGSWTHERISEEEKARMKQLDEEAASRYEGPLRNPFEDEDAGKDANISTHTLSSPGNIDGLPKYALTDPGAQTGHPTNSS